MKLKFALPKRISPENLHGSLGDQSTDPIVLPKDGSEVTNKFKYQHDSWLSNTKINKNSLSLRL